MAVYTAKLSVQDAAFPLLSRNSGRPTFVPSLDTNSTNEVTPSGLASNASSVFNAVAKPHMVYVENALPRNGGFSSIGYLNLLAGAGGNAQNAYTLQVRNMSTTGLVEEFATIVFFKAAKTVQYLTQSLSGTVNTVNNKADYLTQGNAGGVQFLLQAFNAAPTNISLNEVRINAANNALELPLVYTNTYPPSGINAADFAQIRFCCGAGNYLILAKPDGTVYWNNPTMGAYLPAVNGAIFTVGAVVTGGTSGAVATVQSLLATGNGICIGNTAVGTFQNAETVTSKGVQLNVAAVAGFTLGEVLKGSTSGATATYAATSGTTGLQLGGLNTGIFQNGETILGETSGHTAAITSLGTFTPSTTIGLAITAPDYTPSLTTGAGFEIPSAMQGQCIGLQSFGDGFIMHTTTGSLFAKYSQNAQYPWVFVPCYNSSPIGTSAVNTMATNTDSAVQMQQLVWTDSGILEISLISNAQTYFPEVSDFIAGQLIEQLTNTGVTGTPQIISSSPANAGNMDVALARIGSRYFVISYGLITANTPPIFTQALVYDIALKRWGKLVANHVCVVPLADTYAGVADLHEIGLIAPDGTVLAATEQVKSTVGGIAQTVTHNGVLIIGGINFVRGNLAGVNSVSCNFGQYGTLPDVNAEAITCSYANSWDAMNLSTFVQLMQIDSGGAGSATFGVDAVAPYHFFKFQGNFHISECEVKLYKAGNM